MSAAALPRRVAAVALALALLALAAGCGEPEPVPYESLRVVVDTNVAVPDELDAFSIEVTRKGVSLFSQNFDRDALDALPDSLVLINESPNNDSPEKQLESVPVVTIIVTGYLGPEARVSRSARLRFNRGKIKLPLPLCRDCLDKDCDAGATCKRGACVDSSIGSVSDLPSDDGELDGALSDCGP